jgi:hypothetical protein
MKDPFFPFNWSHFLQDMAVGLLPRRSKEFKIDWNRIGFLAIFVPLFLYMQIITRVSYFIDTFLYPKAKDVPKPPLFIVGNFRTGSTFLHRLMSKDRQNFIPVSGWEIYAAPTITQRKIMKGIQGLDRLVGAPLMRLLRWMNDEKMSQIPYHRIGVWEPEEDDGVFVYMWEGFVTWFFFPSKVLMEERIDFDDVIPRRRRRRMMNFYRRFLGMHSWYHAKRSGKVRRVLSKNPAFSPRIKSLRSVFNKAQYVHLVRDPKDTLSSAVTWFAVCFHFFASPLVELPMIEQIYQMILKWYRKTEENLKALTPDQYITIRYPDLVGDPKGTVERIYDHFDIPLGDEFRELLEAEMAKAQKYQSKRPDRLAEAGITDERILRDFRDIYEKYGFDTSSLGSKEGEGVA